MKIIKNNAITSISATSADAGHPVSNLLNDSPKKKWTAADSTVTYAVIEVVTTGSTDAVGIIGITAESFSVLVLDPNGINWENVTWENVTWAPSPDSLAVSYVITDEEQGVFNAWVDFSRFTGDIEMSLQFRKTRGTPMVLSAGVVVVGETESFNSPKYGLTEGLEDYSLSRMLSNGATYYKKRDIVRKFSGAIDVLRDNDFYRFMHNIARAYGSVPMMWLLVDNLGNKWVVYGRLTGMPSGSHLYYNYSEISFDITEVL